MQSVSVCGTAPVHYCTRTSILTLHWPSFNDLFVFMCLRGNRFEQNSCISISNKCWCTVIDAILKWHNDFYIGASYVLLSLCYTDFSHKSSGLIYLLKGSASVWTEKKRFVFSRQILYPQVIVGEPENLWNDAPKGPSWQRVLKTRADKRALTRVKALHYMSKSVPFSVRSVRLA